MNFWFFFRRRSLQDQPNEPIDKKAVEGKEESSTDADKEVKAPFSDEQIALIKRYQALDMVHELTSPAGKILIPTRDGLISPDWSEEYLQTWVPSCAVDEEFITTMEQLEGRG